MRPASNAINARAGGMTPAITKMMGMGTNSESGPAMAIETGMNAIETKKSRLATRPIMSSGTNRCSNECTDDKERGEHEDQIVGNANDHKR